MSPGQSSAGPSAAKLGGVALIGVGALAAVFGVANVLSEESGGKASGGGPTSSVAAPPQSGAAGAPVPPETSRPATSAPESAPSTPGDRRGQQRPPEGGSADPGRSEAPQPGGSGGHQQAGQGSNDQVAARQRITMRVYNNSMVEGLAHRAADDFRASGYRVVEVGNYSGGRVPVTTIYYRPGTPERAQARIVADRYGARVEPRFPGIRDASPGVIAIVTKNYDGPERGK